MLRLRLHDQVIHLALDSYVDARTLYWSQQEASLSLSCIVRPRNARDVSTAVWILGSMSRLGSYFGSESGCPFAIRGGGHSPVVGSANMEGGVTIDLSAMKDVSVRADRSVVSVGAGSKWRDVYLQLDPMGLTVTGGRVTTVGAAGLTLGGVQLVSFTPTTTSSRTTLPRQLHHQSFPTRARRADATGTPIGLSSERSINRRSLILLVTARSSVRQRRELRDRTGVRGDRQCERGRECRSMARAARRLKQLWRRHTLRS